MLKELKGTEYALEVLRVLHKNQGEHHNSKCIAEMINDGNRIQSSPSYIAKILPRMRKAGLLVSSESGYRLAKRIDQITVDSILDIFPMPEKSSPMYELCSQIKRAVSMTTIDQFYDFE